MIEKGKKGKENVRLSKEELSSLMLEAGDLCAVCNSEPFDFETTDELEPFQGFIGQDRAVEAIKFGLGSPWHGYNIYAVEPSGSGRNSVLLQTIREAAGDLPESSISDVACVRNFEKQEAPKFLRLGRGQAVPFANRMDQFLRALKKKIPKLFQDDKYLADEKEIRDGFAAKVDEKAEKFNKDIEDKGIPVEGVGYIYCRADIHRQGLMVLMVRIGEDRRILKPTEFSILPADKQNELIRKSSGFAESFFPVSLAMGDLMKEMQEEIQRLREDRVGKLFGEESVEIREEHGAPIFAFMDGLRRYTIEHLDDFFPDNQDNGMPKPLNGTPFIPFRINVLVNNGETEKIPIIYEGDPTYGRLFGGIDHRVGSFGASVTDHTMIRAGSLLKANGGILILPEDILSDPHAWSQLVKVLRNERLDIGEMPGVASLFGKGSIVPETIKDIKVKVVLVGSRLVHDFLLMHPLARQDIKDLFKVTAEFDSTTPRTTEATAQFMGLISTFCAKEMVPAFEALAVAEILNYACRIAEHRERFSLDMREVKGFVVEAAQWARIENKDCEVVTADHVRKALEKSAYRVSLRKEKIYGLIKEDVLLIDLAGSKVGQVNCLVVYDTGEISFGRPSRVTARTFFGSGGVVNIQGAIGHSGPSHKMSFEILKGYLGGKYAQCFPLSFSATVSFEQSYGRIDGDSASLAEVYVVLSDLSGLPLDQGIAVTGSMNQRGEVQPVGRVIEKAEGFFDVCSAHGLTGSQGVIIPRQNIQHIVLREDVVRAVEEGKFHIWAISRAEEGLEILTGVKAGEVIGQFKKGPRKGQDKYPEGTINYLVSERLRKLSGKNNENNKSGK